MHATDRAREREAALRAAYGLGLCDREVGAIVGSTSNAVHLWRRRNKLPANVPSGRPPPEHPPPPDALVVMAVELAMGIGRTLTLREAGRVLGMSRERVRSIEARAIGKLRSMLAARGYGPEDLPRPTTRTVMRRHGRAG